MGLTDYFMVTQDSIKSRYGAEIVFRGLKNNISGIRSLEGINIAWVEEAENVSENSWNILIPTIREENSEIWVSFNPDSKESSTYKRFVTHPREDMIVELVNWQDNEKFPEVLRREMEYDRKVDQDKYRHIWEGQLKTYGEDLIIKNFVIEEFETPSDAEFRYGADFGFSIDPTVLGRMFIKGTTLFIDYEAYGHGIEISELERFFDTVPESRKWKITADSERPDTISFLRQRGFNIVGALKGKGSVEDGIQFLRAFERIIIHPRCPRARDNFQNYRWKRDKVSQEILPIPAEGSDHWPDAARYGLEDYIKNKKLDIKFL